MIVKICKFGKKRICEKILLRLSEWIILAFQILIYNKELSNENNDDNVYDKIS